MADLAQAAYQRIAIGLPASVPVGRYTKGVLEAAGQWAAIEPKMIGANNVRQALDYVARAEVDAGFVYATDAALMPDKVKVASDGADDHAGAVPGGAVVARARTRRLAHALRRLSAVGARAGRARQVRIRQALTPGEPARMEGAWIALALTLKVALWATALNLLLGVGIGYAMARCALCRARSARCGASRCRW